MDSLNVENFKAAISEILKVGWGKVTWEITIQNHKVQVMAIKKESFYKSKIDTILQKDYSNNNG